MQNRDGRLTPAQWLDLIFQPLIILILLFGAFFLVFGEDMLAAFDEVWWFVLPVIALLVFIP